MANQSIKYANPVKLYYGGKEFTIGSLGLEPQYALALYRVVKFKRPDGVLNGITFKEIMSIRTIGEKKARVITETLAKIGVEVKNVPEIKITEPTRLIEETSSRSDVYRCSNCDAMLFHIHDNDGRLFNCCPMCGKKLKW